MKLLLTPTNLHTVLLLFSCQNLFTAQNFKQNSSHYIEQIYQLIHKEENDISILRDTEQSTQLLHGAADNSNHFMTELLLKLKANPNQEDLLKQTPLFYAHNPEIADSLVKHKAKPEHLNGQGATALLVAASLGKSAKLIQYLCSLGINPNQQDQGGNDALFALTQTAAKNDPKNLMDSIIALLDHGATVYQPEPPHYLLKLDLQKFNFHASFFNTENNCLTMQAHPKIQPPGYQIYHPFSVKILKKPKQQSLHSQKINSSEEKKVETPRYEPYQPKPEHGLPNSYEQFVPPSNAPKSPTSWLVASPSDKSCLIQ